jgi:hypothetical protein
MSIVFRNRTTEGSCCDVAHWHMWNLFNNLERVGLTTWAIANLSLAIVTTGVHKSRQAQAQCVVLSASDLFCAVYKVRNLSRCNHSGRHWINTTKTQLPVLIWATDKYFALNIDECCMTTASIDFGNLTSDVHFLRRELILKFSETSRTIGTFTPRINFSLIQNHKSLVASTRNHIDPPLGQLLHKNRWSFNFWWLFDPELALLIGAHRIYKIVF